MQCPAPPESVELLEPARKEHLRRCRVRRRALLAPRDDGLSAAPNVGVLPQVRVGASDAAAVSGVRSHLEFRLEFDLRAGMRLRGVRLRDLRHDPPRLSRAPAVTTRIRLR